MISPDVMLPVADLLSVTRCSARHLERFRGGTLLITGASGFFGRWMLESLVAANRELSLGVRCIAHAGHRSARVRQPDFDGTVRWLFGEVHDLPELMLRADLHAVPLDAIVHLAVSSGTDGAGPQPYHVFDRAVRGASTILSLARGTPGCRVLMTSSGAVYGRQLAELTAIPETALSLADPLDVRDAYGAAKRALEFLAAGAVEEFGTEAVIARPFAFVGPRLPLDGNFAAGNFIRDALRGGPIVISGEGTALRSYLYAGDLAAWLWALLAAGRPGGAYNVGASTPVSIRQLANTIAELTGTPVIVKGAPTNEPRPGYVPDVRRITEELNLSESVGLPEAVRRTLAWHRSR
jgi:nucleoside-diphosphate-sugar epimerase